MCRTISKAISASASIVIFFSGPAFSGPYDDGATRPGTQVDNRAVLSYSVAEFPQKDSIAEAGFMVSRRPSGGRLTALKHDPSAPETLRFRGSAYESGGAFRTMAAPRDLSRTGDGSGIPVPGTIGVSEVERIYPGAPVFFRLDDAGLNLDGAIIDTAEVNIVDTETGDSETIRFRETGPDTGTFTAWVQTVQAGAMQGDGTLSTVPLSRIEARYIDPYASGLVLTDTITVGPVDPFGTIFDSATGAPIDGIEITIVDADTGEPARVYGRDLESTYPSTIVTGSEVTDTSGQTYQLAPGEYRFPFVDIGTYRYEISDDARYAAPSERTDGTLQTLDGAPFALDEGSRLGAFDIVPGPPVEVDIPMDPRAVLTVSRTATADSVEIGEFLEYRVDLSSTTEETIDIRDVLPAGIDIDDNSLRIDGKPVSAFRPTGGIPLSLDIGRGGRSLLIDDLTLGAGETITITYVAQVDLSAESGKTITTRTDVSGPRVRRLSDTHDLAVSAPFDLDTMAIVGDVSAGACRDEPETVDLSGIRVFLETGDYAVTDSDGRFSFRGISRGDHVVQIDELTLPLGARVVMCEKNVRNAGSNISRFVDVAPGLMARAEFRIVFDDRDALADPDRPSRVPALSDVAGMGLSGGADDAPDDRRDQVWIDALPATTGQGLLSPRDGTLPRRSSIDIAVLRRDAHSVDVKINGTSVPSIHREPALSSGTSDLNLDRWRGVQIQDGRNVVEVKITAPDGTVIEETAEVLYATDFARAEILTESSRLSTDGRTTPVLKVRFTSSDGIPLRPGTRVSARVRAPFAFEPDGGRRRSMDGTQKAPAPTTTVTVGEDGVATLVLSPVLYPGTAEISFPRGAEKTAVDMSARITAAERPWVLVGLAEGTLAQLEIARHMRRPDDLGDTHGPIRGRVALFAEGVIKGEWLLTMRYDSGRSVEDGFYGIDPDKDYIVYGDRSTQDNAAQGRYPLYVRLKREDAELLLGDFQARIDTRLLDVDREVTGLKLAYETDRVRVLAFAAEAGQSYIVDRIALDGSPGPFELTAAPVVSGSETVRVVTVDRDDATEEVASQTLSAGSDYVMDRLSGRIFLRHPIPALTPDFDRNVLVVDYEVDGDAETGLFAGGRVEADIAEGVTAGASALRSENVSGGSVDLTAIGADVSVRPAPGLELSAEALSVSKRAFGETTIGKAGEVRVLRETPASRIEAYAKIRRGPTGIDPEMAGDDVNIFAAELERRFGPEFEDDSDDGTFLEAEVRQEDNLSESASRSRASALATRRRAGITTGAGLEFSSVSGETANGKTLNALGKLGWKSTDGQTGIEGTVASTLMSEGSDVVTDAISVTARRELSDAVTIFGTVGAAREAGGSTAANALSAGIEVTPWEGGEITAGLARAGGTGGQGAAVFAGARQQVEVANDTLLSFGIDAQQDLGVAAMPLGATVGDPYIREAFATGTIGLRKTTGSWSAGVDLSHSVSESRRASLLRLAADGEMTDRLSVGGEALIGVVDEEETREEELILSFGAALRGEDRAPITVFQIEGEFEQDSGRKYYASVNHHRYLGDRASLNLRGAVKWTNQSFSGKAYSDRTTFVAAEVRRDLGETFDAGIHGMAMRSRYSGQTSTGYGASIGLTPFENGRINIGYNFEGFRDPDFSENGYTDRGAFIEFKLKFDQNILEKLFR